jgi:hypothetical protein
VQSLSEGGVALPDLKNNLLIVFVVTGVEPHTIG